MEAEFEAQFEIPTYPACTARFKLAKTVNKSPSCMAPCFVRVVMLFLGTTLPYFSFECNLTLSVCWNNN